jgi:hypothetical protein
LFDLQTRITVMVLRHRSLDCDDLHRDAALDRIEETGRGREVGRVNVALREQRQAIVRADARRHVEVEPDSVEITLLFGQNQPASAELPEVAILIVVRPLLVAAGWATGSFG